MASRKLIGRPETIFKRCGEKHNKNEYSQQGICVTVRGGRPSKSTVQIEQAIVEAVENGASLRIAARAAGIAESTLYDWRNRFPEFSERLTRARATLGLHCLELIKQHSVKSPHAAIWMVERLFPGDYGRNATGFEMIEPDLSHEHGTRLAEKIRQSLELTREMSRLAMKVYNSNPS